MTLIKDILSIAYPDDALPLVFDSPHSGRIYPQDFNYSCATDVLERAEDNYVEDLFESVPHYGGTFLQALFPRTYIDVNRAADDIDPDLLHEPDFVDEALDNINPSSRSHAGIGLIRRLVKPGIPVYEGKLTHKEIKKRIDQYYIPYHDALKNIINDHHYNYGQVWHINCHSMPSSRHSSAASAQTLMNLGHTPDFVLGDRDGTSCSLDLTHSLRDFLKSLGYRVAINDPYRGVELVRRYADPATGRHSIQIEINKALYWNEDKIKKYNKYNELKTDIEKLVSHISAYASANLVDLAAD